MDSVGLRASFLELFGEGFGEEEVGGFGLAVTVPGVVGFAVLWFVVAGVSPFPRFVYPLPFPPFPKKKGKKEACKQN